MQQFSFWITEHKEIRRKGEKWRRKNDDIFSSFPFSLFFLILHISIMRIVEPLLV